MRSVPIAALGEMGGAPLEYAARVRPPSVDRLARGIADVGLPHPLLVEAARTAIAAGEFARRAAEWNRQLYAEQNGAE